MSSNLITESPNGPPTVRALNTSVGSLVHDAHENGVQEMQARADAAGLTHHDLETILTYCAEHRCEAPASPVQVASGT